MHVIKKKCESRLKVEKTIAERKKVIENEPDFDTLKKESVDRKYQTKPAKTVRVFGSDAFRLIAETIKKLVPLRD
jgi:hypothetical protein